MYGPSPPPNGHYRRHPIRHARPLPSASFPLPHPMLFGLDTPAVVVVVHFDPLPDGQGRVVGQQEGVEAAELGVVAAVDDGDRGGVFVA